MLKLLPKIKIRINDNIYVKDPDTSELGRSIIGGSIKMIDEVGFENYNFRKLASTIGATETAVYRYFENKHKLLLYLVSWYWGWVEYNLAFRLVNIKSPDERLKMAIGILTEKVDEKIDHPYINIKKLQEIIISESSKTFLTRDVDTENKNGVYDSMMQVFDRVSSIILEINPSYKYPHMLISTVVFGAFNQRFFSRHLPGLTDLREDEERIGEFYSEMTLKLVTNKHK